MRYKFFVAVGALAALAGCGGGSSMPPGVSGVITRGADAKYSADSLLLASRASDTPWIPLTLAASIEADLLQIRTTYPALVDVHARPFSEPKTLLVTLKPDAPAQTAWRAGNLTSGDTGLNKFLADYNATKVQLLRGDTFVVTFAQWLNTDKLAPIALAASANVASADQNTLLGDGDQIKRSVDGAVRNFLFVKGWGDCTAGCTRRHTWIVVVAADNSLSKSEAGSPLP